MSLSIVSPREFFRIFFACPAVAERWCVFGGVAAAILAAVEPGILPWRIKTTDAPKRRAVCRSPNNRAFFRGAGWRVSVERALERGAGFQPAVSPISNRQSVPSFRGFAGGEASAGWKPAIQQIWKSVWLVRRRRGRDLMQLGWPFDKGGEQRERKTLH